MIAGQVGPKQEENTAKRQNHSRQISRDLLIPLPSCSGSVSSWQVRALQISLKAEDEAAAEVSMGLFSVMAEKHPSATPPSA